MEETIVNTPAPVEAKRTFDPSFLTLLLSNLITIVLAVINHWSLQNIMIIYVAQSLIIGLFTFIEIFNTPTVIPAVDTKLIRIANKLISLYYAGFFLIHYGGFHFIYIFFMNFTFKPINNLPFFIFTIFVFFLNHLYSFLLNWKKDKEKFKSIGQIYLKPYARIIPMHIAMVFGLAIYPNVYGLVAFLILKTLADLAMHINEHSYRVLS